MRARSLLSPVPTVLTVLVVLVGLLGPAGCGGEAAVDDVATRPSDSTSADVGGDPSLQLREVTTTDTSTGQGAPSTQQRAELDAHDCTADAPTLPAEEPKVACDADGTTYLLAPAAVDGGVVTARASQDAAGRWVVDVELGPDSTRRLADLSGELAGTAERVALVLDGEVLGAPTIGARITGGVLQLSPRRLDEARATDLAERIQAGA